MVSRSFLVSSVSKKTREVDLFECEDETDTDFDYEKKHSTLFEDEQFSYRDFSGKKFDRPSLGSKTLSYG